MSEQRQIAAVRRAARRLADELSNLERRARELEEGELGRQFTEGTFVMLGLDELATVCCGDGEGNWVKVDVSRLVADLLENDGIPETHAEVVRAWRDALRREAGRLDAWLEAKGGAMNSASERKLMRQWALMAARNIKEARGLPDWQYPLREKLFLWAGSSVGKAIECRDRARDGLTEGGAR